MTGERDAELGRLLEGVRPPEHRPRFWDDLHAELSGSIELGRDDAPERRRSPWLALSAAAAIVLVALAGLLLRERGGDREAGIATNPSPPTTEQAAPSAPAEPLRPEGAPRSRGSGRVVGIDPSGSFLYVAAPSPEAAGCEGMEGHALFVEPIDGGERRLVAPATTVDATGQIRLRFGSGGDVAMWTGCDGGSGSIIVGRQRDDGTLSDLEAMTRPSAADGEELIIGDVEFRSAGVLVIVTSSYRTDDEPGTAERYRLSELTIGTGELTDLGPTALSQVAVAEDGRLATLSPDGTISFAGEVLGRFDAFDIHVTKDGAHVLAQTSSGVVAIDTATEASVDLEATAMLSDIRVVPGSRSAVLSEMVGDGAYRLVQIDLATGQRLSTLFEGAGFIRDFGLRPDASGVIFDLSPPLTPEEGAVVEGGAIEIFEQRLTA
jgi:hypothetical protein